MVNPDFLKLKKYLTLDEASQYIAHYLRKEEASNKEVLFLINEGLVSCFLDCSLDPVIGVLDTEYMLDGWLYMGIANGLQRLINPKVEFYYKESPKYTGNIYYTYDSLDLIGDFYSLNECSPSGEKTYIERSFKQVIHHSYGEIEESDSSNGRYFKVETDSLITALSQISTTEELPTHAYKGIEQENRILSTLKELGYNPESLPKATSAGGAKAQVKKQLDRRPPFEAKTSFDNAWKVLLSREQIKNS